MTDSTLIFYVKIVYTNISRYIEVNSSMTVMDFIANINTVWRSQFNIHHFYNIQVVATGNRSNGDGELAPRILPSIETMGNTFDDKTTAFYLRPVHPTTGEFERRESYQFSPDDTW